MNKNMGSVDKIMRVIVAIVAVALFFTNTVTGTMDIVLLVVAGVFLFTSTVSFCPLYTILGIKTRRDKND